MSAKTNRDADILAEAVDRFKQAMEATQAQLDRETEDLKFQVPEMQWPDEAKLARQGGKIGNVPLPPRPMLSIPKLAQPIRLIENQERAAQLAPQIVPISLNANQDTADMLREHYRQIDVDSKAHLARSWAFSRALKCGRGFYRILTEYDPHGEKGSGDLVIRIKRLLHQESALLDPFAEEPDGSDAEWGFLYQWIRFSRYRRMPGIKKGKGYGENGPLYDYSNDMLDVLIQEKPMWARYDTAAGEYGVLLVEYFSRAYKDDDPNDWSMVWRKMNGAEILDEQPWPGRYVPIVQVLGEELIPFDSERRYQGMITPNKDAQRFFNYAASSVAETIGQEPKATFIMAEGQEEGHEQEFLLANVRNFPYLRYKPKMVDGELAPPPTRVQADTSKLGMGLQSLAMANDFIQSGTLTYDPSLGNDSKSVKSGRQAMAYQQQHEAGNSNWLNNLARAAEHEACIVLDLIKNIYDRPGRMLLTRTQENKIKRVLVNQPYYEDNGQIVPVNGQVPPGIEPSAVKHYDLKSGASYACTANVSKGYKSALEEGSAGLSQLFEAEPELFKLLGDIWLDFQTFPGHKMAADRIRRAMPPELRGDEDQNDPRVQLGQLKQALAQAQAQMQQMAKDLETDAVKVRGQVEIANINAQKEVLLQEMKNASAIAVAQVNAAAKGVQMATEAANEAQATGREHAFQANQAAMDRQHEQMVAASQQQHDAQMAGAQAQADAAQSGADRAHEAGMAAAGHEQAMTQADQAAAHDAAGREQEAELNPPAESE